MEIWLEIFQITPWQWKIIKSIGIVIITMFAYIAIRNTTIKHVKNRVKTASSTVKKRLTVLVLCVNLLKYVLLLIDIMIILGMYGINVKAFLAGLGLVSLVVGLALQDMLKDFICGLFIIIDDQYSVGDYVEIDGFRGSVITVGLKSTKVKNYLGDVRVFSNRKVEDVTNYSKQNSKAVVYFTFDSNIDLLKVEKVIDELLKICKKKEKDITGVIHYKGVEEYEGGKIKLKVTADCVPLKQFKIESIIKREAKLLFDKNDIHIV